MAITLRGLAEPADHERYVLWIILLRFLSLREGQIYWPESRSRRVPRLLDGCSRHELKESGVAELSSYQGS